MEPHPAAPAGPTLPGVAATRPDSTAAESCGEPSATIANCGRAGRGPAGRRRVRCGVVLVTDRDSTAARPAIVQQRGGAAAPAPAGSVEAAAATILPSVVQVRAGRGSGSGVIMDDRGHVLTNHHVVDGADEVTLVLSTGRRVDAEVIGSDRRNDIAVLQTTAGNLPAATLGASDDVRIGQTVIAVGSPLGLNGTVTAGVVSSLDRREMIQTDASINPGNSGGPLVDLDGKVIGINTSIATLGGRSSGNIGIGFAVPIDRAADVAQQILRRG